jgi:hypothetical protein
MKNDVSTFHITMIAVTHNGPSSLLNVVSGVEENRTKTKIIIRVKKCVGKDENNNHIIIFIIIVIENTMRNWLVMADVDTAKDEKKNGELRWSERKIRNYLGFFWISIEIT